MNLYLQYVTDCIKKHGINEEWDAGNTCIHNGKVSMCFKNEFK